MSASTVLLATARIRPGMEKAFQAWQVHHQEVIGKFPGFIGSDMIPPESSDRGEWTIILNFQTPEQLRIWQESPERAAALTETIPFLEGGNLGKIVSESSVEQKPEANVTEVILSKIKPGMDAQYREWCVRIQDAQSKYPGYRGMFLQPPTTPDGRWTTLVRFDTAEHLESWMAAPEREILLKESKDFIEHEELTRLATSFPGWVPVDPVSGKGPPDWKTALLVLLGLFPLVMLEMRFLGYILGPLGVKNPSLATFFGNAISVALTSFITMPLCVRWFGWWLFPQGNQSAQSVKGSAILCALFALEVIVLWKLIP